MRSLVAVNVLDAFIGGAYLIAIPLLLVERKIDIATIGLVFSTFPVVFVASRMLFASAADSVGLRKFFNVNAFGNLASVVLYAISSSPFAYSIAKAAQGVKESSLWAVNRNAVYETANSEALHMATSTLLFVRSLAIALGAVVSGFIIQWIGFQWLFLLLAVLSVLILIPARMLDIGKKKRLTMKELFGKLDPRSVDRVIWRTSLVLSLYVVASTLVVSFVLPIFLNSRGLGYWEIGMIFAVYTGVGAFLLPVTLRKMPSAKIILLIQCLLYLPAVVLIPISSGWCMIVMVVAMAFGDSTSYMIWEWLTSETVRGCRNIATSIGFLFAPSNLIMIPSFVFAGILVEKFGYVAPFWTSAAFFFLYSLTAWRMLKSKRQN